MGNEIGGPRFPDSQGVHAGKQGGVVETEASEAVRRIEVAAHLDSIGTPGIEKDGERQPQSDCEPF